ncbi:WD repeat-containing protein on Y chromosome-like [Nothobranchius furzeri]|uniref:WD repeat-containing protein on Y chromosome-like n=1 Tax=Nothobranchius furzeri TaxID=105023 RepID=UPI003904C0FC
MFSVVEFCQEFDFKFTNKQLFNQIKALELACKNVYKRIEKRETSDKLDRNVRGVNAEQICDINELDYGLSREHNEELFLDKSLTFGRVKSENEEKMRCKTLFPGRFEPIPLGTSRRVVKMTHRPVNPFCDLDFLNEVRNYQDCEYFTICLDGTLKVWTDSFKNAKTFALKNKETMKDCCSDQQMIVHDMLYIPEISELAVCTAQREVYFYDCKDLHKQFKIRYCLLDEEFTTMSYYYSVRNGMLSLGDKMGNIYILFSKVVEHGLFSKNMFESVSLRPYPTIRVSSLLQNTDTDFLYFKLNVFNDWCSNVQFYPQINSFLVCGLSAKRTIQVKLSKKLSTSKPQYTIQTYESTGKIGLFICATYTAVYNCIVTGGEDGKLRLWKNDGSGKLIRTLQKHTARISHLLHNPREQVIISVSADQNMCVWSEYDWVCKQSFRADHLKRDPITSVYLNTYNNELIVSNTDMAKTLGRGTNLYQETMTSHNMPLCGALYDSAFNQVLSICQKGEVKTWDLLTGEAVMQFSTRPDKPVGQTILTFDDSGRKIITMSDDLTVRLWNFYSGQEITAREVKLPNQATCIVCRKGKMFISVKKSNNILIVDYRGFKKTYLEHRFLEDVCKMEFHGDKLIAISSGGSVVVWDVNAFEHENNLESNQTSRKEAVEPICLKLSLQPCSRDKLIRDGECKPEGKDTFHIGPIVSLRARDGSKGAATLLMAVDGSIYALSTTASSGVVGKFEATEKNRATITCMTVDEGNATLLTGDSTGKVCIWDINKFCVEVKTNNERSVSPPPLVRAWNAGVSMLVSIIYFSADQRVITASHDQNLTLWTYCGENIGVFGRHNWKDLPYYVQLKQMEDKKKPKVEVKKEKNPLILELIRACYVSQKNKDSIMHTEEDSLDSMQEDIENLYEWLGYDGLQDKERTRCNDMDPQIKQAGPPVATKPSVTSQRTNHTEDKQISVKSSRKSMLPKMKRAVPPVAAKPSSLTSQSSDEDASETLDEQKSVKLPLLKKSMLPRAVPPVTTKPNLTIQRTKLPNKSVDKPLLKDSSPVTETSPAVSQAPINLVTQKTSFLAEIVADKRSTVKLPPIVPKSTNTSRLRMKLGDNVRANNRFERSVKLPVVSEDEQVQLASLIRAPVTQKPADSSRQIRPAVVKKTVDGKDSGTSPSGSKRTFPPQTLQPRPPATTKPSTLTTNRRKLVVKPQ